VEHLRESQVVYLILILIQARNDWSQNLALGEHLVHVELFPEGAGNIEAEQEEILNQTVELGSVILYPAIA